jgi:hypothetical protein
VSPSWPGNGMPRFRLGQSSSAAIPRSSSRTCRRIARASRRRCLVARLYLPCFVRDARIAAMPASVRGPVDGPPYIRHRPFGIAGALQGVPALVRAPQRGASSGLPVRLPFFSQPRPRARSAWGLSAISALPLVRLATSPRLHVSGNDGLPSMTRRLPAPFGS